jgi:hypothetical protein
LLNWNSYINNYKITKQLTSLVTRFFPLGGLLMAASRSSPIVSS